MNYDDERANRIFTLFCYTVLASLFVGAVLGVFITALYYEYCT